MSSLLPTSRATCDQPRRGSWALTWTVAVVCFLIMTVASEFAWRALRYRPTVIDSPALWKYWYSYVSCGQPKTIAIIGSSRIQTGISAAQLRLRLPQYRVSQLGKYGGESPIGVLRALADDDGFKGIVICDTLTPFLVRTAWDNQRELYECPAGLRLRFEAVVGAYCQDSLSFNSRKTGVMDALRGLIENNRLPPPSHVRMRKDRTLAIDFAAIEGLQRRNAIDEATYRRRYRFAHHPTADDLREELSEIDQFVGRIQARGGQVVFVRMPSSGGRLQIEEEYHPKVRYWDRFATMSRGVFIHAADLTNARGLTCPDNSHLDSDDALRFTDALVDDLFRREVIKDR